LRRLILPYLIIAGTAIDRSALSGFKRYFSFLATLSTNCRILLQIRSSSASSVCFSCLTAGLAALWLVGITLLREKLLLRCSEREIISTFYAPDLLVGKTHLDVLLYFVWLRFGYPDLLVKYCSIKRFDNQHHPDNYIIPFKICKSARFLCNIEKSEPILKTMLNSRSMLIGDLCKR